LALRAWAPVFASIRDAFGDVLFERFYPAGRWEPAQEAAVRAALRDQQCSVAVDGPDPVGFVTLTVDHESKLGEIYMIAVDPPAQGRGIASVLTAHAESSMRSAGMTTAMVETGADPGHAPARATYARAGFRLVPVARYFKAL
jgi:ribosomal protein S18 acetylase RimI-like enzyme